MWGVLPKEMIFFNIRITNEDEAWHPMQVITLFHELYQRVLLDSDLDFLTALIPCWTLLSDQTTVLWCQVCLAYGLNKYIFKIWLFNLSTSKFQLHPFSLMCNVGSDPDVAQLIILLVLKCFAGKLSYIIST